MDPAAGGVIEVMASDDTATRDFEAIAAACYPRLVARIGLVVRDGHEAQDLAQEALVRMWRAWPTIRQDDAPAWLHVVGLRLALNELRRRKRLIRRLRSGEGAVSRDVIKDPGLWAALGALSRGERAALILHVLDGYSYDEIAQGLQVPVGTVASWLSRGKLTVSRRLPCSCW